VLYCTILYRMYCNTASYPQVYLPLAWGVPLIALGYNIYTSLMDMGKDPKCVVGWETGVKWNFFLPLLTGASIGLILMSIVLCNLATPAIRKNSILEEVGSVSLGMTGMTVYYSLTWATAPLAYINFPDVSIPDFYPCFQVMNSWMGILVFLLLGLCSTRFRVVLAGTVLNRKNLIMERTAKETRK